MKIPNPDSSILCDRDALVLLLGRCGADEPSALADRLLGEYGTIDAALDHFDTLGLDDAANVLAACVAELGTRRELRLGRGGLVVDNTEVAGRLLLAWYYGCTVEQLVLLCLDEDYRLVECRAVASGGDISVRFDPNDLLRAVTARDAKYVLIAHNHPATPALPSRQDVKSTALLLRLFRAAGFELLDHIVVYGDDFVSMRESGLLDDSERFDAELSIRHSRVDYTKL